MTQQPERDDFWGKPISVYTREQAIQDGVLVLVGGTWTLDGTPVTICFTSNLFADYRETETRRELIERGLRSLNESNDEDDGHRRFRVVEEDRIWAIWDGDGITFMRPEDY